MPRSAEQAMQRNRIDGAVTVTDLQNCIDACKNVHVRAMSYFQSGALSCTSSNCFQNDR